MPVDDHHRKQLNTGDGDIQSSLENILSNENKFNAPLDEPNQSLGHGLGVGGNLRRLDAPTATRPQGLELLSTGPTMVKKSKDMRGGGANVLLAQSDPMSYIRDHQQLESVPIQTKNCNTLQSAAY